MGIHDFYKKYIVAAKRALDSGTATKSQQHYVDVFVSYEGNVSPVRDLHIDANSLIYDAMGAIYLTGKTFSREHASLSNITDKEYVNARLNDIFDEGHARIGNTSDENLKLEVFELVYKMIMDLVASIRPSLLVSVNFDGQAPWAKVMQQRERRYGNRSNIAFDTVNISPGTPWMIGLDKFLEAKFLKRDSSGPEQIILSSTLSPGEGEHKIVDRINSLITERVGGSTVIYSNDSDVVLLAMRLNLLNIYICSSFSFPSLVKIAEYMEIRPAYVDRKNFINIAVMIRAVNNHIDSSYGVDKDDFIFAMSIIGNDFIPRPYSFRDVGQAIENIMLGLHLLKGSLIIGGSISLTNLKVFIEALVNGEGDIVSEVDMIEDRVKRMYHPFNNDLYTSPQPSVLKSLSEDGEFDVNSFYTNWYEEEFEPKNVHMARDLGLRIYSDNPAEYDEDVNSMCREFLRGMSWVYSYYSHIMSDVDKTWFYPFHYAPLIRDVSYYLESLSDSSDIETPSSEIMPEISHQLVAIVPSGSIHSTIIPLLRPLWTTLNPIIAYMPIRVREDKSELSEKDLWRSVKLVPFITFKQVDDALKPYKNDQKYHILNQRKEDYIFRRGAATVVTPSRLKPVRGRGRGRGR